MYIVYFYVRINIGDKMKTEARRIKILEMIKELDQPISATKLSNEFKVSRQAIVQDIAILKAMQQPIIATSRGYIYQSDHRIRFVVTCLHNKESTEKELLAIVDLGGCIENVIVEHPIYGEICGTLNISSRYDVQIFIDKCNQYKVNNLSDFSNGIHYHTISCNTRDQEIKIIEKLKQLNYLYGV